MLPQTDDEVLQWEALSCSAEIKHIHEWTLLSRQSEASEG